MLNLIKKKILIASLIGVLFAAMSFLGLMLTNYQFKATAKVLIVQDQLGTQDYYSLTKSAEYLGNILEEAVYSTVFIDTLKKEQGFDKNFFPTNQKEQLKKWKKMVEIDRSAGLGILKIVVVSDNKKEAYNLANSISNVLINKNYLFRGKTNVDVRKLSDVLVESNPNFKIIIQTIVGSFLLGFILTIIFYYYVNIQYNNKFIDGASLKL